MLGSEEDHVPDRWDEEFNEAKKVYHYDRDTLISLQGSPLCLQKPVFLYNAPIILEIPHAGTTPLDPTKSINLKLDYLTNRLTNRPKFSSRKSMEQMKFEHWWSQKQIDTDKVNEVADKRDEKIEVNGENEEENSSQGKKSHETNEDDVSACEEIIKSCVESVLKVSDGEDDVNNNEIPQPEEKGAQKNVQDNLVFEEVKSVKYPSRNLSINMAIINRRRMSSSMRVGSSRLKRVPPPSRPHHPSVQSWRTADIPDHLVFDELVSPRDVNNEQVLSPRSRGGSFYSINRSPSKINLVSVSKDLIIDPEKENSSSFDVSNDLAQLLNNIITNIDTVNIDHCFENVDNVNDKYSINNQFIKVENMNGTCHSEELPSSNNHKLTPFDEKTSITCREGSSSNQRESVSMSASSCRKYFNDVSSNITETTMETFDNLIDITSRTDSLHNQGESTSNSAPNSAFNSVFNSAFNSAFESRKYFNDVSSKTIFGNCNGISETVVPNFNETEVGINKEDGLMISDNYVNKMDENLPPLDKKHHRNLIAEFDELETIQHDLAPSRENNNGMVENYVDRNFSSEVGSHGVCVEDNQTELVDSLIKLSIEEFVDPTNMDKTNLYNFENFDFTGEHLINIPVRSDTSEGRISNEDDTDSKDEDIFFECEEDLDPKHYVEQFMEEGLPLEQSEELFNEAHLNTQNPTLEQFINNNLDLTHSVDQFIKEEGLGLKHPVEECTEEYQEQSHAVEQIIKEITNPIVQCTEDQNEHHEIPGEVNKIKENSIQGQDISPGYEHEDTVNYEPPAYFPSHVSNKWDTLDEFDDDLCMQEFISSKETKGNPLTSNETNKTKKSNQKTPSKTTNINQQKSNKENIELSKKQQKTSPDKNKTKESPAKTKESNIEKSEVTKKRKHADTNKKTQQTGMVKSNSTKNQVHKVEPILNKEKPNSIIEMNHKLPASVPFVDNAGNLELCDENISHEEWQCQESKKARRKRTSSNNAQQPQQSDSVKDNVDRNRTQSESFGDKNFRTVDPQQRYTPSERACASTKAQHNEDTNLAAIRSTSESWSDPDVVAFCNKSYVMYILRGIPGSGKSTIAQKIQRLYQEDNAFICSADDVSVNYLGQYEFQASSKLEQSHSACRERARAECLSGRNVVIIDNTNIKPEAFHFYLQLAHHNDYIVNFIETGETDIDKCFQRNKHSVPRDTIAYMKSVYEEYIAFYYGWCMSISDTFELRCMACSIIESHSMGIPGFKSFVFQQNINKVENLFHIYNMRSSSSSKNMLHVTACYTSSGQRPGSKKYVRSKSVLDAIGQVHELQVIGLCITQTSLFARVLLSEKQKLVWGNDDACNGEINKLYRECNFGSDNVGEVGNNDCDSQDNYNIFTPTKLNERVSKMSRFIQNMEEDYLLPDFGLGCTAHITLGVIDGCNPVTSRDDLKAIICAELDEKPKLEYRFFKEMIRMYRDNLWVMYFKESLVIPSMFCGTYFAQKSP